MSTNSRHIISRKLDGPYQQEEFRQIWLEHFQPNKSTYEFECFKGVVFYKQASPPIYINVGATNTKSVIYELDQNSSTKDIANSVFLIYDIPHHDEDVELKLAGLKLKTVPQYEGFICDLSQVNSVEEYLQQNLSSRSRSKLRNYANRLNKDHKVHYKMVWGDIDLEKFDFLFDRFHELLVQRFENKQIVNNNLEPTEWSFYKDVTLPMLRKKDAGLFVAYIEELPVAITLLNFSGTHVYDVIRVFDIEFADYRIGSISIMHQIDWCIRNNFKILDFSKGYYDYKKRWSTNSYHFHYHIWYDPKKITSLAIANAMALKFKLKYWARKHNLLKAIHKIRYRLGNKPQKSI